MLLLLPIHHDLKAIRLRKQQLMDANVIHHNQKRLHHDYQPIDEVLIMAETDRLSKLAPRAVGPFRILRVHVNGTVTLRKNNTLQRLNIRCLHPYFRRAPL
jgi:hypothetical protein